jgi:hypothetical protein
VLLSLAGRPLTHDIESSMLTPVLDSAQCGEIVIAGVTRPASPAGPYVEILNALLERWRFSLGDDRAISVDPDGTSLVQVRVFTPDELSVMRGPAVEPHKPDEAPSNAAKKLRRPASAKRLLDEWFLAHVKYWKASELPYPNQNLVLEEARAALGAWVSRDDIRLGQPEFVPSYMRKQGPRRVGARKPDDSNPGGSK